MNFVKKQNAFGWVTLASALVALIGLIIYIVSSTTGFMKGSAVAAGPIVLTLLAIAGLVLLPVFSDKLDPRITGGLLFVTDILLAIGFCLFVVARVQLFADVYFIPVNYPATEGTALNVSIAGMVFYGLAIVGTVVAGFAGRINKENA